MVVQMTADSDRTYSDTTLAVMSYTTAAVSDGYRRHPDVEIPAPGPCFAEMLQVVLSALTDPHDDCTNPTAAPLPPAHSKMTTWPSAAPEHHRRTTSWSSPRHRVPGRGDRLGHQRRR